MDLENLSDAFGHPVEFGNWYAFSANKGGFRRTTVGVAIRATGQGKLIMKTKWVIEFQHGEKIAIGDLSNVYADPHVCFKVEPTVPK